jgi:hypothetical protein
MRKAFRGAGIRVGRDNIIRTDLRLHRPREEEGEKKAQGRRLAEERSKFYATATEAANALGISVPTYCAHENGGRQIRPDMARFYAQKFDITPQYILYGAHGTEEGDPTAEKCVGRMPPTPAARAVPDPLRGEASGFGAQLLAALGARRTRAGRIVALDAKAEPALVPSARSTEGFVPELGAPTGDPEEPLVAIRRESGMRLVFSGVFAVPLDQLEHIRLVAIRLRSNALLSDLPGGQRLLVDVDDADASRGLFLLAAPGSRLPVPVLVEQKDGERFWRFSRKAKPIRGDAPPDDYEIIGRAVMAFSVLGEDWLDATMEKVAAA